ncbi:MAG: hypothetical protein KJ000_22405 [Pirellulaceae bacterium]|nr:hypothetical protein [Pirellulaceae bacterium]
MAEVGDEVGQRGGVLVQRGQILFHGGIEVSRVGLAEAGLGAGEGEVLDGLLHLGGQALAAAAFEFFEQVIALLRPRGGG